MLLVPGTTLQPDVNFDWNYGPALAARGQPYCWVELPGNAMGDIQVAGEYVAHAIRTMHDRAGRMIDVVGFSPGGMVPRWSLKYWPDTRDAVRDVVGIDPSNHGTLDAYPVSARPSAPRRSGSSRPARASWTPSTTVARRSPGSTTPSSTPRPTRSCSENLPPAPSSELRTGDGTIANVSVQQVCPGHVAEHLSMGSTDPVGYAVVDAVDHDGPAEAGRVDRSVCAAALMPGVDPAALTANEARYLGQVATTLATYPHAPAEPPLREYARR